MMSGVFIEDTLDTVYTTTVLTIQYSLSNSYVIRLIYYVRMRDYKTYRLMNESTRILGSGQSFRSSGGVHIN